MIRNCAVLDSASGIICVFSAPRDNGLSKRNPRSTQGGAMSAMMSVRILKLWERSDLPASAGQEKAWLPQCHLAIAASAAFRHKGDRGLVWQQHPKAHRLC